MVKKQNKRNEPISIPFENQNVLQMKVLVFNCLDKNNYLKKKKRKSSHNIIMLLLSINLNWDWYLNMHKIK